MSERALKNYFSFRKRNKGDENFGLLNNTEMNYWSEGAFLIYEATQFSHLMLAARENKEERLAIIGYIKCFYCRNMIKKFVTASEFFSFRNDGKSHRIIQSIKSSLSFNLIKILASFFLLEFSISSARFNGHKTAVKALTAT